MPEEVRVLIPLDGSRLAEHALAYVPLLVPLGVTHVELLSVITEDDGPRRDEAADRERHLLETYLTGLAEEIRQQTALEASVKVLVGQPATAIVEELERLRPETLIMSTHGASGVSRWRLGSVADKVIRTATNPTLVVGPEAVAREELLETRIMPAFKAILVPLDGSELAETALPIAARFVEAFGAEAHLVTVKTIGDLGTDAAWAGVSPQLDEDLAREASTYLEDVSARHALPGNVRLAVRFGSPADSLEDYVKENGIDLVIMSSHGRGGLLRTALGSTTDRLLGSADAPLLIVRGKE